MALLSKLRELDNAARTKVLKSAPPVNSSVSSFDRSLSRQRRRHPSHRSFTFWPRERTLFTPIMLAYPRDMVRSWKYWSDKRNRTDEDGYKKGLLYLRRKRCTPRRILRVWTPAILGLVYFIVLMHLHRVPARIRTYINLYFNEKDAALMPEKKFSAASDADAIMIWLPEREKPTIERWKSLGFPNGVVFQGLHKIRDRKEIKSSLTSTKISIGELAILASAKKALGAWLRRSDRSYVILFEDDVRPAGANVPARLKTWSRLPTIEDDSAPTVYFLGETVRCGRYNTCIGDGIWRFVRHRLAGAHAVMISREAASLIVEMESVDYPWDVILSMPPFVTFRYVSVIDHEPAFCGLYRQANVNCENKPMSIIGDTTVKVS